MYGVLKDGICKHSMCIVGCAGLSFNHINLHNKGLYYIVK
jgi:hypothetical protein